MISWRLKRKLGATLIILAVIGGFFVIRSVFYSDTETCTDGIQNQNERGIDCGGVCTSVCQNEAEDVAILWTRIVPVIDDVYSVVAMIENPNSKFVARNVPYTFKLYDSQNILVYERKGSGYIPSGEAFPFFETAIRTGERVPVRALFEFREIPLWENTFSEIDIEVVSTTFSDESISPKLTAIIRNKDIERLADVSFTALLFDSSSNLINASRSILSSVEPEKTDTVVFTWPEPFSQEVAKIQIIETLTR